MRQISQEAQTALDKAQPLIDGLIADSGADPRPYQQRICTKTLAHTYLGVKTQLINSPTGSGKTVMGWLAAAALQREYNIGVGWIAMRRNLLIQAAEANQAMNLGCEHPEMISMFQKELPTHDALGRPIKLLIVDEAQHDAASTMTNIHNVVEPDYVVGLSATPYRTDRIKLCFQKVIRDAGIHQLIEQGYLSQFHQYVIPNWDVDTVTTRYLAEPERFGKSVIFFHQREDAMACTQRINAAGIRAELVVGDDPLSKREEQLEAFDKGEVQVLVNMMILTEGFDCPSLQTVFVRDSMKGPTIQMAGRVLRKYDGLPFKQIVQSQNTKFPMPRHATPANSYIWQTEADEWRGVQPNDNAKKAHLHTMRAVATIQTSMPTFITRKRERPRRRSQEEQFGTGRRPEGGGAFIH